MNPKLPSIPWSLPPEPHTGCPGAGVALAIPVWRLLDIREHPLGNKPRGGFAPSQLIRKLPLLPATALYDVSGANLLLPVPVITDLVASHCITSCRARVAFPYISNFILLNFLPFGLSLSLFLSLSPFRSCSL
jgi:hypothetical protein